VTAAPDWVTAAFHAEVTRWSPPKAQPSRHEVTAGPRLVTVTCAVKPPVQSLAVYATEHTAEPPSAAHAGCGPYAAVAPAAPSTASAAAAAAGRDRRRPGWGRGWDRRMAGPPVARARG
jgi:hypothetical protein